MCLNWQAQLAEQAEAIDLTAHQQAHSGNLEEKVAKWVEKAKNWTASPEAGKQLKAIATMGAKCAELQSEIDSLRQQLAEVSFRNERLVAHYAEVAQQLSDITRRS